MTSALLDYLGFNGVKYVFSSTQVIIYTLLVLIIGFVVGYLLNDKEEEVKEE